MRVSWGVCVASSVVVVNWPRRVAFRSSCFQLLRGGTRVCRTADCLPARTTGLRSLARMPTEE